MHKVYEYNSCFSELITQYISERRNAGFMFDNPAYWLYRFDQYCSDNKIQEASISKKTVSRMGFFIGFKNKSHAK
ncbi:hypothetical protein [Blautia luti]|uniref:Integrase SAM-like N-terminal domain-containing protein n=1 Tax=Blautia luti TaxID=89014 RepID=A0A564W5S9_9FIRM|nr:hypothetical protein [Blautia luti]VUX39373.1 Uncharacterised protein [Blautia luti]